MNVFVNHYNVTILYQKYVAVTCLITTTKVSSFLESWWPKQQYSRLSFKTAYHTAPQSVSLRLWNTRTLGSRVRIPIE